MKYLNESGLARLWSNTKSLIDTKATKAITLGGYGITDAYTKAQSDANINVKADKSNSLSGYGITNAYTKTEVDSLVSQKATKATTLSGYGITNAYTTIETDTLLNAKSNTTHTHTMSQITNLPALAPSDAQKNSDITKAEIEAKLTGKITTHSHDGVPAYANDSLVPADTTVWIDESTNGSARDFIERAEIVNVLSSNSSSTPLSAAMGKKLSDEKMDKSSFNLSGTTLIITI